VNLRTVFRPFHDADQIEGTTTDQQRSEHERQVRGARLATARRQSAWVEIPETRLVRRGPFFVDADTDFLYILRRGVVFEPGGATIGYVSPDAPMTFTVNQDDDVVFIEHPGGPRTWSRIVERKARREHRAAS
jgi:hypothetical protein